MEFVFCPGMYEVSSLESLCAGHEVLELLFIRSKTFGAEIVLLS